MNDQKPLIVLTEPAPLPADETCPQCKAGPERRGPSAGFGQPHILCTACGYRFPESEAS